MQSCSSLLSAGQGFHTCPALKHTPLFHKLNMTKWSQRLCPPRPKLFELLLAVTPGVQASKQLPFQTKLHARTPRFSLTTLFLSLG